MATLANQSQANLQSFGQNGFNVVTDANAHTGDFSAITILTDTVFDSITGINLHKNSGASETTDSLDGITIPAGVTIFGNISAFELASGNVIAYFRV